MDALEKPAFEMRVGIHTGPVVAGIVGVKKFQVKVPLLLSSRYGRTHDTSNMMPNLLNVLRVVQHLDTTKVLREIRGTGH